MTLTSKILLLVAGLALAACNNPRGGGGAFGDGDGFHDGGLAGGPGGIYSSDLGDPNDPGSIAHFNQRIGDRVFFSTDSTTINDEGRATLAAQARWLNANTQYAIVIEGHADERGTREYNVSLGGTRAASVQQFLVSQGVRADRIQTVSFGKERPVEACAAQRCWDLNRRAVTVLSRGLSG